MWQKVVPGCWIAPTLTLPRKRGRESVFFFRERGRESVFFFRERRRESVFSSRKRWRESDSFPRLRGKAGMGAGNAEMYAIESKPL